MEKARRVGARVLWAVCALLAALLALAVLLIAIDANPLNGLVRWILARADDVDLGFFDLDNPVKDLDAQVTSPSEDVRTALLNYGLAALVWLGLGKLLERVVAP